MNDSYSSPDDSTLVNDFRTLIVNKLTYAVGVSSSQATPREWFVAVALAVRDKLVDTWHLSAEQEQQRGKHVYYLSMEFLIGRLLFDNLNNSGWLKVADHALRDLGIDLQTLRELEPDAALGNGGLGRLAACYMESMATLDIPAYGYGIRYEHGMFRQSFADGYQQEEPEDWLEQGNPWEFAKPQTRWRIGLGGEVTEDEHGKSTWLPETDILATAYDIPVVGWRGKTTNTLRLWRAEAENGLALDLFNAGKHVESMSADDQARAISQILYPGDDNEPGRELRLAQEFFFTSASLQDLILRFLQQDSDFTTLPERAAIQLNDTHPALAVAELMRLLVDSHGVNWDDAWHITVNTIAYTNHTLLPEALEKWPLSTMARLLPRHLQLIEQINTQHLQELSTRGIDDAELLKDVSLIDYVEARDSDSRKAKKKKKDKKKEKHGKVNATSEHQLQVLPEGTVKMGNLAFLGSHSINGVSGLHTELMRSTIFKHFNQLYPDRINNKTNGITFRRWLFDANPRLTELLVATLGEDVLDHAETRLKELAPYASNAEFRHAFSQQRQLAKQKLIDTVNEQVGISLNPDALFDVQIKRIHEYKRQLLNVLHIVALYQSILDDPHKQIIPRVKILGGKAAPSYRQAKLIIKLANDVARTINANADLQDALKVVFLPNYNVSLAEILIPAADLSEQISTAGYEASGTSNMKFALNGALTIGTMDGANVEMSKLIGQENMFIFGMDADEVDTLKANNAFNAKQVVESSPRLAKALKAIRSGAFSPEEPDRYVGLVDGLLEHDAFFICADFDAYWKAQGAVEQAWLQPDQWWQAAILNTANTGWFSADRSINEYARDIWGVRGDKAND
ncbi:glycogen/starch/alpha-glucan phosphorylase [Carnimonas nigrificans]|uniref:glycogen/starch/alpha-glucan phosphorylase n=1 Tax=Carnimonas nigrificans TaxID=64323 RepID=UPI000471324D|nr:glycogen/starch/alpha-glucan phosphorylase [Carnimonas nigrificans]